MRKLLSVISIFFYAILSTVVFAVDIHEGPDEKSKIIAIASKQLMPIIYSQKRDWIKVANPINGDVGWAKVDELKGPLIITKMDGSEVHQQIITKGDGEQPQVYSIIQYSGPREMKAEDVKKMTKEMEKRHQKLEESMRKMRKQMQENILETFKGFDEDFYTFPIIQPIIVVPDNRDKGRTKK
jgi:hypothetical protein